MRTSFFKLITAFSILTISVHAQKEFSFESLNMPVFGETGHLEQILTAESGFGPFDRPVIKNGEIEFYTAKGEIIDKGSKLFFDEATFIRADDVIEGSGLIRFESSNGDLSGTGFTYDLKRSKLSLHSRVAAHFEETEVTGDGGEATIRKQTSDGKWVVSTAVISGNVVATGFPERDDHIDRVETNQASYTGHDQILVLSSPVNIWTNGTPMEASADEFRIILSEAPSK